MRWTDAKLIWTILLLTISKALAFSHSSSSSLRQPHPTTNLLLLDLPCTNRRAFPNTIMMMTAPRRDKQQRLYQTLTNNNDADDEHDNEEPTIYTDQLELTKIYRGVSMLHFAQVLMAFKKSGVTLGSLNVVGGPLMATGLMILLGDAAESQQLQKDTFKRLNGLMVLYATLALSLVALVPQIDNPFGLLFLLSGSSTLFAGVKGYFAGLQADGNKSFLAETQRLFQAASNTTMNTCIPSKQQLLKMSSLGDFISLWVVAIKKIYLVFTIGLILTTTKTTVSSMRLKIAPHLSHFMKLTILGGSLITTMSIQDSSVSTQETNVVTTLSILISYVFSTMAAFVLPKAVESNEFIIGFMFAVGAIASTIKGIRNWNKKAKVLKTQ